MSDSPLIPDVGTPVPATMYAPYGGGHAQIVIGDTEVNNPIPPGVSAFLMVVVDLSTLDVVATAGSPDNSTVPPAIAAYANKPGFFLLVATNKQLGGNIPQGDLYAFLMNSGADAGLKNLEQIMDQIGSGTLMAYSYILAGSLDSGDIPGFEAYSTNASVALPMQFVPVTVNGQTTYAPSQYSTA